MGSFTSFGRFMLDFFSRKTGAKGVQNREGEIVRSPGAL